MGTNGSYQFVFSINIGKEIPENVTGCLRAKSLQGGAFGSTLSDDLEKYLTRVCYE